MSEQSKPSEDLRIALVQADTVWHDADANRELYGRMIRALAGRADLIVLPETFLSGFSNDAVTRAEAMDGVSMQWLKRIASEVGAVVTGSAVIRDGEQVYNRLVWAEPDKPLLHYDKRHLFRMAREHERYAAGKHKLIVELKGWRICPLVCYDLRFPVWIRNRHDSTFRDRFDYDLLLFVANWPAARRYAWQTLLRARAIENLSYVVGVNRVGTDGNEIAYAGDSVALDFLGMPIIECGSQPISVVCTLSAQALHGHRQRFPAFRDADDFELKV
jgi:predicted amidohydrolase